MPQSLLAGGFAGKSCGKDLQNARNCNKSFKDQKNSLKTGANALFIGTCDTSAIGNAGKHGETMPRRVRHERKGLMEMAAKRLFYQKIGAPEAKNGAAAPGSTQILNPGIIFAFGTSSETAC